MEMDKELVKGLKQAKSRPQFFAYIAKASHGKLIVSKKKVPAKAIKAARDELGCGTPIIGKVSGPLGNMLFEVVKAPPGTLGAMLKKIAKVHSGLTIKPSVQIRAAQAEASAGGPKNV
jgi:hypothetical protein